MKQNKNVIRLTESQFKQIVAEEVKKALYEIDFSIEKSGNLYLTIERIAMENGCEFNAEKGTFYGPIESVQNAFKHASQYIKKISTTEKGAKGITLYLYNFHNGNVLGVFAIETNNGWISWDGRALGS